MSRSIHDEPESPVILKILKLIEVGEFANEELSHVVRSCLSEMSDVDCIETLRAYDNNQVKAEIIEWWCEDLENAENQES